MSKASETNTKPPEYDRILTTETGQTAVAEERFDRVQKVTPMCLCVYVVVCLLAVPCVRVCACSACVVTRRGGARSSRSAPSTSSARCSVRTIRSTVVTTATPVHSPVPPTTLAVPPTSRLTMPADVHPTPPCPPTYVLVLSCCCYFVAELIVYRQLNHTQLALVLFSQYSAAFVRHKANFGVVSISAKQYLYRVGQKK